MPRKYLDLKGMKEQQEGKNSVSYFLLFAKYHKDD
jgi:hypothetical protein